VTIEEKESEVVLKPAAVVKVETYSNEDIVQWNKEDRLEPAERNASLKRLRKRA
jgi:antitoxin PrlF